MCHPLYSEIKTENHKTHSNLFEIPIITILSFATCTNIRKNPIFECLRERVLPCTATNMSSHNHQL